MVKKIEAAERVLSAILFVAVLLTILWQIITRKIFGSPAQWSDELSRLMFVYMAVLGCHIAQRDNIHVRIDAIMGRFSKTGQLIIEFVTNFVMTVIFLSIAYYGFKVCQSTGINDKLVTLHLPVSVMNFALVALGVLMSIELIAQMVNIIRRKEVVRPC